MYRAFADSNEDIMFGLENTYNQAVKVSQNVVEDIRFGRKLYLDPVDLCSSQICEYKNEVENILIFLIKVKDKNPYMYSHPVNVAFLSLIIGNWLGLDDSKLLNLVRTGLLHDIGKAKIKDSLLNKAEALTSKEVEKLKSHPVISYKMLNSLNKYDIEVLKGVLFHHERMDGTGYPLGIRGNSINLYSKIIAIADTFDALTSDKTYRNKYSHLKALEEIKENSSNLDKNICNIFLDKMTEFYCSREVRLNNERTGSIVALNPEKLSKPLVRCDVDYYDLTLVDDLEIVEFL